MKVLYVSDLDGTLLRSNARTSEYTNHVINELVSKGMLFSYATARSYHTAAKVTDGLNAKIPIITYNGAVILQNDTYEIITRNVFSKAEADELLNVLIRHGIYPIVYSYISGKEKFSYIPNKCNTATAEFLITRKGDVRDNPVELERDLGSGEVFYFTCIDEYEKLEPLYIQFKEKYHCFFQREIYSKGQWLEIVPKNVSKANAILQLRELLGIEYIVAFGDGKNDIDMFEIAEESYAVENAVEELKAVATGIIGSNDSDGVARWLYNKFRDRMSCVLTKAIRLEELENGGDVMENALELIRSRRSTRKYKAEEIPEEQLNQIIEAGRFAPSGGNCQSTHFIVVKNRAVLAELASLAQQEFAGMEITPGLYKSIVNSINASKKGNYVFHYNAPVLIITANQKDYGNNIADCACALENMMLMANALDLGSCWINQLKWLNENPVILEYMKKLGMDESERVYGALAVGYPDTADGSPVREPLERMGNRVTVVE